MYVGATISFAALDDQEFSYLLKRETEILGAADESESFYIPLTIDPVSALTTLRRVNQPLFLIEADGVYAQSCILCDLTNLHLACLTIQHKVWSQLQSQAAWS
jgi:hypothetical protein